MRIMFIAWDPYTRRSDVLAQRLGASMHHIFVGQRGRALDAPWRYLAQARQTCRVLSDERPDVVFVQNPPIFCALLALFHTLRFGGQFVIDSHTAAFVTPKWKWSLGLHRLLSRRAAATLVHNESQAKIVKRWGCRFCIMGDPLGDYPLEEAFPLGRQFNVAVVSTFGEDEPLELVIQAACHLPEVEFYVTGDSKRAHKDLLAKKPDNCHMTGYLRNRQYMSLLQGANAVLDLTTREQSLLSGAFEAVSVGTPLIVSDWRILRDYYSSGAVYVSNTVQGICEGIRQAQREQIALKQGILQLRTKLQIQWEQEFSELRRLLQQC